MTTEDCVVVSLQAQAQDDLDVEVQVNTICSVVEESQKGWNGLRSDRVPTFSIPTSDLLPVVCITSFGAIYSHPSLAAIS